MILYCVLVTTKQNQPYIEYVGTDKVFCNDLCEVKQEQGLFAVVVEKELNRLPEERRK